MAAVAIQLNFIGFETVAKTPSVKISLVVVCVGAGLLPLVCETARSFVDSMQLYFPFLLFCVQGAALFEWASTGNAAKFWVWAPNVPASIFLLTYRRRYFLVGYPVTFFLTFVAEVPILCAVDPMHSSQFLFSYDTYTECVLRGYLQMAVVLGAVGGFLLFLALQKLTNYIGALRAATTSRDAHRALWREELSKVAASPEVMDLSALNRIVIQCGELLYSN